MTGHVVAVGLVAVMAAGTTSAFHVGTGLQRKISGLPRPSLQQKSHGRHGVASLRAAGLFGWFNFNKDKEQTIVLPQDPSADQAGRKAELKGKQEDYKWIYNTDPAGTPYLEGLPTSELPSLAWISKIVPAVVRVLGATIGGAIGPAAVFNAFQSKEKLESFLREIGEIIRGAAGDTVNNWATTMGDFDKGVGPPLKKPQSMVDYDDDLAFARLRLQGPNCVVIQKCSQEVVNKFQSLGDAEYKGLKSKVDDLLSKEKLYVVDMSSPGKMQPSVFKEVPKYIHPAIALFEAVDDPLLSLRPLAIQLTDGAAPIFTPEDGYSWSIAKACFHGTDGMWHEMVTHLGQTHLTCEGFMTAMNRQLPSKHPIHALLAPHFEGTALINFGATKILVQKNGPTDELMGATIEDIWVLITKEVKKRLESDFSPEADLAARHMTKEEFPGMYPYRDIGLQYWDATLTWVQEYLEVFYGSTKAEQEANIAGDYELQAFMKEMVSEAYCGWMAEVTTSSDQLATLAKILASVIYTGSTLHAAVNFPQKPIMGYTPAYPLAVWKEAPTDKSPKTFEDYISYLPPLEVTSTQVQVTNILGSVIHTKLGDYEPEQFDNNERVQVALSKFQSAIEDIEEEIQDRNADVVSAWKAKGMERKLAANYAYNILLPDNIPQSINI